MNIRRRLEEEKDIAENLCGYEIAENVYPTYIPHAFKAIGTSPYIICFHMLAYSSMSHDFRQFVAAMKPNSRK